MWATIIQDLSIRISFISVADYAIKSGVQFAILIFWGRIKFFSKWSNKIKVRVCYYLKGLTKRLIVQIN